MCESIHVAPLLRRCAELALYVLPRAMDSLYLLLCDRRYMASVPHGEKLLFCAAMATLMYCHEREEGALSGLVRQGLGILVGKSEHAAQAHALAPGRPHE